MQRVNRWGSSLQSTLIPAKDENHAQAPRSRSVASRDEQRTWSWQAAAARTVPRVVVGMAIILLVAAIGLFGFRMFYDDRIYPAVAVGDVNVGGLTSDQAEDRMAERAAELENGAITFHYGDQTWTPTLSELGATVHTHESVADARELGRTGDASERLAFTGTILRSDQTVPLRTSINPTTLDAWFDQVDADLAQPAVNAELVLDGTNISVSEDSDGLIIDREAAQESIMASLERLEPVDNELPTLADNPDIRTADLEEHQERAAALLSTPVDVTFEDQAWQIEPEALASMLTVETTYSDSGADVALALDKPELTGYLREEFSGQINRLSDDARVGWSTDYGLISLDDSVDGVALKPGEFATLVSESFLGDQEPVSVPVVVTSPQIDSNNLGALNINSQLARGDSNYAGGNPDRDYNVEIGTSLLNGTLVPPGGEFSFNDAVGEIGPETGFVEAGVTIGEQTGTGYGGGVCQVSTTVFRAAILSGMPVTEWWPHSYRLTGYEADGWGPGFDASILQHGDDPDNWSDFKFENNTDGWLLIESWNAYPHNIVNIYGNDDGRTVDLQDVQVSDPIVERGNVEVVNDSLPAGTVEQTEWPQDGLNTSFVRKIYDANGNEVGDRLFATNFLSRGNVYEVSPDMAGSVGD